MLISILFWVSCSSMACRSEWNHSAEPKSRMTQVKYTLDSRVGFPLLKLFIRYQIDFKILSHRSSQDINAKIVGTYDANGVTPIPAPTRSTVSYFKKSS